ncbi:MAG: ABC transporter substrate-binding protein [Acidobacteriota bacterium]
MRRIDPTKFLLTSALALLLTACGGGPDGVESARGVTADEVVLGTYTDLSGPAAILGVAATNGARMRFDEANAAGGVHGRSLRYVVEDTGYQVPRALQAANKLIHRDRVFAVVLGFGTPMNNAIMPMLFEEGIPNLFPFSGARSMVEPFQALQVTARGVYYDEIRAATRYFIEEQGAEKPCVIYQDTDYGQEIFEGASDQVAAMGRELAAVSSHEPTETELTAAVLRLREAGCDLVLTGTVHRDTILVLEAARKMGWTDVRWVGNNASYNEAVAGLSSGAAEGYSVFAHIARPYRDDADLDGATAAWWDRYVEAFGVEPEYAAMEGYRNADLVIRALDAVGPEPTAAALMATLEGMAEHVDPFGYRLTFGADDHKGVDESVLLTIEGGRWRTQAERIRY